MTLNVGLIGCGLRGRFHSRAIRAMIRLGLVDARYVAVCDIDEKRAQEFGDVIEASVVTTDPGEIIASPEIDVVYITVPTAAHKELVLQAAAKGKHIFCEKPLATNLADVREMVAAVEEANVKTGVGLILRHSPILTVLKSLMEDSTLGRLMAIVFRDDQFFPVQGHYGSEWRKDWRIAGSGTLLEHSIHDADILRWLGGEVRAVRGSIGNFAGYEGVEDLATVHMDYESGAKGELISIWHSVLGRPSTRRIEVFMEKGVFFLDHDYLGPIQIQTHAKLGEVLSEDEVRAEYLRLLGLSDPAFGDALKYALEDYFFLIAVSQGADPFPAFRTALEAHRIVDAAYRSAAAGGAEVTLSQ